MLMKFAILVGDRFILLVTLNVYIFYAPINKKCPHFIFKTRIITHFNQKIMLHLKPKIDRLMAH